MQVRVNLEAGRSETEASPPAVLLLNPIFTPYIVTFVAHLKALLSHSICLLACGDTLDVGKIYEY